MANVREGSMQEDNWARVQSKIATMMMMTNNDSDDDS